MKSDTTIPLKADEAAATLVEMLFRLQRDVAQMNRDDAFCEDLRVREPALYVENFHVTHVTVLAFFVQSISLSISRFICSALGQMNQAGQGDALLFLAGTRTSGRTPIISLDTQVRLERILEFRHECDETLPQDLDPVKVFAMAAFAASPQHLH